jgi:hypothetical protein
VAARQLAFLSLSRARKRTTAPGQPFSALLPRQTPRSGAAVQKFWNRLGYPVFIAE